MVARREGWYKRGQRRGEAKKRMDGLGQRTTESGTKEAEEAALRRYSGEKDQKKRRLAGRDISPGRVGVASRGISTCIGIKERARDSLTSCTSVDTLEFQRDDKSGLGAIPISRRGFRECRIEASAIDRVNVPACVRPPCSLSEFLPFFHLSD